MQPFSQRLRCALAGLVLSLALKLPGAAPYGLESRAAVAPFLGGTLPPTAPVQSGWRTVKAFPNLTFRYPVGLVAEPRTNRLWVHTREGQIYSFENSSAVSNKTLVLNLEARNQGWDDSGLLGLALHPDFGLPGSPRRGYFYVFYQYTMNPTPGPDRPPSNELPAYNRLSRFTVPDGSAAADTNSELILIDQFDRSIWHNGGAMFFNPDDGFLYLALGDEGPNPIYSNSQVINKKLFGGVIRIDVNQDPSKSHPIRRQPQSDGGQISMTANYFIPDDNPFLDAGGSRLEEFWCLGLRSPHRMTYDPPTQTIWLGEVGEITREEINIIEKGGNYQWGYKEGTVAGPQSPPAVLIGAEKPPLYEYSRTNGDNCVIGGYVYRGAQHSALLNGKYIYGDNGTGRIWSMETNAGGPPTVTYLCNMPPGFGHTGLSSFGIDHSNELYMCQMGVSTYIYKLDFVTTNGNPAPALLSQLGAFSNLPSLTIATTMIPFEVNSPLWSDGAIKTRWMAIPSDGVPYGTNEQISYSATNEWLFPAGSVFVKHFELGIDETNPVARKRLETRVLVRDTNDAVYGLTYKWRADNSEADVLPDSLSEELTVKLGSPVGSFTGQDIGGSTPAGSTSFDSVSNVYTVVGGGADIFGASDQFHFAWQHRTGDFDVKVRIESFSPSVHLYTKAGLMARESLAGNSRHVFAAAFTDNQQRADNVSGYEFNVRPGAGGAGFALSPSFPQPLVNYPNTWIRLKRAGDLFNCYASQDGVSWKRFATYSLALPQTVYFGMAVTSHSTSQTTTARFRDFANNREHIHYYPSRQECLSCHTAAAKGILGVRTHQLNGLFTYPTTGVTDNQLRALNHLGMLNPVLNEAHIASLPKLVAATNATASPEERVRSYLAANCAHCHRPGGVLANFDARHETPLAQQNLVNGLLRETLGIADAKVIAPSSFSRSMIYLRLSTTDAIKMPPLARNLIDLDAVNAVAEWIAALAPPGTNAGFAAAYYTNSTLSGTPLVRTDDIVNFNWGFGSPHPTIPVNNFSARWRGEFQPRFSEPYTFYTSSDDGVRLWVNEQLLINNWAPHALTEDSGVISLNATQKYNLRMEFFELTGEAIAKLSWSSASQLKELLPASQVAPPSANAWLNQDVGSPILPGSAPGGDGSFTISASGADIWETSDQFHFVFQQLHGDGVVIARVSSLQNTDGYAKAGVMIRQNLDGSSPNVFMTLTFAHGAAFQRRVSPGVNTIDTQLAGPAAPYWVKLVRTTNVFSGYVSSDGTNWTFVGSDSVPMSNPVYAGLALTAHNNSLLNASTFTNAQVRTAPRLSVAPYTGTGQVRLFIGGSTGASYILQSSTTLSNWTTLGTIVNTNAVTEISDSPPPNTPVRFYRALLVP